MRFQRVLAALVVAWLAAGPAGAQQPAVPPPDFDALLAQAMRLHQAGDLMGAIDAYQAALRIDPKRGDARSNLGAAYVRLGRLADAIDQYQQALETAPGDAAIRFNLALAYYKAAQIDDAVSELEKVVEAQPENRAARLLFGDVLLQQGEDQRVIDVLMPHAAAFPDDLAFGYVLGTALLHQDRRTEAQMYLDRIFKAGESAESRLLMGTLFLQARNYLEAIEELKRAVELNPQLPTARARYAQALMGAGNHEGAVLELQRALRANPSDFDANLQLGILRTGEERFDEATVYLDRAFKVRPRDRAVRFSLANVQLALGKPEDARVILEPLLAEVPDYEVGHVTLAKCYYRLKRKADGDRENAIAERLRQQRQEREQTKAPGGAAEAATPRQPTSNR